ncbi:MAG: FixH family protein [Alphaproteobacteria bacterium]|nr:FixH family protein [Alphaproteobacteria bacterium]
MNEIAHKSDKWIPWYFVLFFLVIALLDTIFVTVAIKTQTGVVTEHAYEKGLAYEKILDKAAAQAQLGITQKAKYTDGTISWKLSQKNAPLNNAKIMVHFVRPVQDGHDFSIKLNDRGNGLYEARPDFPLPGLWMARLKAQWQDRSQQMQYNTALELIAP